MNEELAYRTLAYLIGHYKMHEETIINKDEIEAINFLLDKNEQLKEEIYKSNAVADTNIELAESYHKEIERLKRLLKYDYEDSQDIMSEFTSENQQLKEQQKEFTNYLKSMLENEKDNFSVARVKDVLEKYKEIVGDKQ